MGFFDNFPVAAFFFPRERVCKSKSFFGEGEVVITITSAVVAVEGKSLPPPSDLIATSFMTRRLGRGYSCQLKQSLRTKRSSWGDLDAAMKEGRTNDHLWQGVARLGGVYGSRMGRYRKQECELD